MTVTRRLAGAALVPLAVGALAVSPAAAGPVYYKVKVGIKGGSNLTTDHGGRNEGDMVQEALSASFSLDGSFRLAMLWRGAPPKGAATGDEYTKAIVNGTWTAQGSKWVDVANGVTGPFTCGGSIGPTVTPQMHLHWQLRGSSVRFTLAAVQQELYLNGFASCPTSSHLAPMNAASPDVYLGRFTMPRSAIGSRTISRRVSGPLPDKAVYWRQNCPQGASCSLAWQGTAKLTRTTLRLP